MVILFGSIFILGFYSTLLGASTYFALYFLGSCSIFFSSNFSSFFSSFFPSFFNFVAYDVSSSDVSRATFLDFIIGSLSLCHLVCTGVVSCCALCEVLFAGVGSSTSFAMNFAGMLVALVALGGSSFVPTFLEVIPSTICLSHLRTSLGSFVDSSTIFLFLVPMVSSSLTL